jgi:hypothetical protein
MQKKLWLLFGILITLFPLSAQAVCPLCTVAVGAGVGLSRWLGIDDTITGLWIGGLIVSLIIWTLGWLEKKNIRFRGRWVLVVFLYYAVVVLPLYFKGFIGHPQNSLFCWCGLHWDKLLVGIALGSLGFYAGAKWYFYLKEKHGGRAYFPFQKVVMPVLPLVILTIIFYLLTK